MTLEETIFSEARRLGFAASGIARVTPSDTIEIFERWLDAGNAAGMDFLKRTAVIRADVRNVTPEAKSVITVAARYPVNISPGKGFSTYCRGMDYHIVIRKQLERLAAFIKSISARQIITRICVDSAPVLEREWAIRAGIGWRGRQGQVVNKDHGCCLLIGELLSDMELQPTSPAPNQCGTCRLCVESCPTGALTEGGSVDCRRCLAYMTIEHKEAIPENILKPMGQTLFGCDICTSVCPWNKTGNESIMPEFLEQPMPDAESILQMTENEFKSRFKDTTVYRTGLERLKRNAAVVIKNLRPQ